MSSAGIRYNASGDTWKAHGYTTITPGSNTPPNPGTYKPDATTTGPNGTYSAMPIALSSLTAYTGDLTLTTPNQVISGLKISGRIINKTSGCTIQSCWVMGNATGSYSGDTALVDCNSSSAGPITVQDCLLKPQVDSYLLDGIIGHSYTIQRCEIMNTCDGCGSYSTQGPDANVYIYANYIHDLAGYLQDPEQKAWNGTSLVAPGPSHNDCCQMQGNNNWEIIGNNLQAFVSPTIADGPNWNSGTSTTATNGGREFGPNYQCNAAIQTNQNVGYGITSGVKIDSNWADGGQETFNIAANSAYTAMTIDSISNNRFGRNQGYQGSGGDTTHTIEWTAAYTTVTTCTGNIYEDNGNPVTVRAD